MNGATARATITIEVGPFGRWGDDCSVGQVKDQAAENAQQLVMGLIKAANECGDGTKYRIMSKPIVTVVMVGQGTDL